MDGTTLLLVVILIILVILLVIMLAGDGVTKRVHRHMREINDAIKASDEVDDDDDDENTETFENREFTKRRMFDGSDCDNVKECPTKKCFKETSYKRRFDEIANSDVPMQSTTMNSLLKKYTNKSTLPPVDYNSIRNDEIQRIDKTNTLTIKDNRANASKNRGEIGCGSIRVDNGETNVSDKPGESVPIIPKKMPQHTYKFQTETNPKNTGKGMMRSTIANNMSRPFIFADR